MSLVSETVQVPKELNDVRKALVQVVKSAKEASKDGFQPGKDIPAIVMDSYKALAEALEGMTAIPLEVKENVGESVYCAGLLGGDLVKELAK